MEEKIIGLFPLQYREVFRRIEERIQYINEIRIRVGQPVMIAEADKEWYPDTKGEYSTQIEKALRPDREALNHILNHICNYSIYAYDEELKQGYLSVSGGHRVGIVGQVVLEEGRIKTIKNISGINIRIAHQVTGVSQKVLPHLYRNGRVRNTLIISPPGCGKTTLLRDLIKQISDGNAYGKGVCIGVVDERSEIAGSYMGVAQNDVGMRTDVLDACPKGIGMMMLLRSMSPKVIAIDELGSEEEMQAVRKAALGGVGIVATIHGDSKEEVMEKCNKNGIFIEQIFERFLILHKSEGKFGMEVICNGQ